MLWERDIRPGESIWLEGQTLISLAKAHQLPFFWFGWDHSYLNDESLEFVDLMFSRVTRIFDHQFKCFPKSSFDSFVEKYSNDEMEILRCECGHYNEVFHEFVSQKIITELKQNGY